MGADPVYKSLLIYYTREAGDYTIQNMLGNIITNNTAKLNVKIIEKKLTAF